jgi:hypothetical protein
MIFISILLVQVAKIYIQLELRYEKNNTPDMTVSGLLFAFPHVSEIRSTGLCISVPRKLRYRKTTMFNSQCR